MQTLTHFTINNNYQETFAGSVILAVSIHQEKYKILINYNEHILY